MILAPRSLLLVRPDGMGDLILFEPVLNALALAWPKTRITVLVRDSLSELGSLLFPEMSWLGTAIDPFRQGPAAVGAELDQLETVLAQLNPAVVVACTEQRNWLDAAVVGMLPEARAVALGSGAEAVHFGPQVRVRYPLLPAGIFSAVAPVRAGEQTWQRNGGLLDFLLGEKRTLEPPRWDRPGRSARSLASPAELPAAPYVVCAAAGFANVPLKTWPAERFVAVLQWLRRERRLPAILVGSHSEAAYLREIAAATEATVWISGPADGLKLAGLIAHSQVVLGNDTGLLHLAASLQRPVVGIYGGGTWPRFIPAGPGAVVVNPLPCFGCGWDCAFGDAPCIAAVAPEEVQMALTHVLDAAPAAGCAVVETRRYLPETTEVMGQAAARYWALAAELNRREQNFQETVRLAAAKDGEIRALKTETNRKDDEIQALKRETNGKDAEIANLKRISNERELAAVQAGARAEAIEAGANLRENEIKNLHRRCAELQKACDERLALIQRLHREMAERNRSGS